MATMLETTTAKKLLRPIPGAITKGLLARKAIVMVPMAEEIRVAIKTAFHRGEPVSKLVSRLGFRATI